MHSTGRALWCSELPHDMKQRNHGWSTPHHFLSCALWQCINKYLAGRLYWIKFWLVVVFKHFYINSEKPCRNTRSIRSYKKVRSTEIEKNKTWSMDGSNYIICTSAWVWYIPSLFITAVQWVQQHEYHEGVNYGVKNLTTSTGMSKLCMTFTLVGYVNI